MTFRLWRCLSLPSSLQAVNCPNRVFWPPPLLLRNTLRQSPSLQFEATLDWDLKVKTQLYTKLHLHHLQVFAQLRKLPQSEMIESKVLNLTKTLRNSLFAILLENSEFWPTFNCNSVCPSGGIPCSSKKMVGGPLVGRTALTVVTKRLPRGGGWSTLCCFTTFQTFPCQTYHGTSTTNNTNTNTNNNSHLGEADG